MIAFLGEAFADSAADLSNRAVVYTSAALVS